MANDKVATDGWPSLVIHLCRAIKNTCSLASWNSLPWILGWLTMTVMGPVLAARVAYRTLHVMISRTFSSKKVLCGKVVLITGASSGLGEALAHALYKCGVRLILAARNTEKLENIKETLLKTYKPPELHVPTIIKLDLEELNSIPGVVEEIIASHGRVDILINNAGISYRGVAAETDISVDIRLMLVNFFGQVALTKAILPLMLKRKTGHIVAVSSVQGKLAIPYRSCYTASKHALQGFFDSLRAEVAESKVKVTVISPGYIATNLSVNAVTGDGSMYGEMDETTSGGMSPEYVADSIVGCLTNGSEELVLAPVLHHVAILLRTLSPPLVTHIMKRRAATQRNAYVHKKD
ncbi:dehydrogenase/reductase SDR family protein 7-like isoform X2 [Portunus trituberculatus]|nr:dehydrogenase/reductase SDR family protein 7-like isoform X2 [Portunus trituberculatus]XP_045139075.1 dehydrogenase/reductase SDR family protein 7-like isoform X2 [Portunus trituberculatus]